MIRDTRESIHRCRTCQDRDFTINCRGSSRFRIYRTKCSFCTTIMLTSVLRSLTLLLTAASPQHRTSHPLLPPTTCRRTARRHSGAVCSQTGPMLTVTPRSRPQAVVSCSTLSTSSMVQTSRRRTTTAFLLSHAPIYRQMPRAHLSLDRVSP